MPIATATVTCPLGKLLLSQLGGASMSSGRKSTRLASSVVTAEPAMTAAAASARAGLRRRRATSITTAMETAKPIALIELRSCSESARSSRNSSRAPSKARFSSSCPKGLSTKSTSARATIRAAPAAASQKRPGRAGVPVAVVRGTPLDEDQGLEAVDEEIHHLLAGAIRA